MTSNPKTHGERSRLARVALYYVLLGVGVALLVHYVPSTRLMLEGNLEELAARVDLGQNAPAAVGSPVVNGPWSLAILGVVCMTGALAIMIPVTWIYMITRRYRGFHESVVHTLLILPVAVTGIVIVVGNSLALAFSLAGIVAAVRFRTTLEDTKDAVYVFLAIGVGLASGVQALGLAMVLSLMFNAVILILWATRFGNPYATIGAGPDGLSLGDAMMGPGSSSAVRVVGDAALLDAAAPEDWEGVLEQAARMERHLSAERAKKKKRRANALVLVHASSAERAQAYTEDILSEVASRWKLADIAPAGPDDVILEYLARLDGPAAEGMLLDRLREAPPETLRAAELRTLKTLKRA
ncbi:MAG: DUF4956 domain-containing protein [Gemmatimonadota bacterium]|jgi:hypothetical protein